MSRAPVSLRPAVDADIATLRTFEQGVVEAERPLAIDFGEGELTYYDLETLVASDTAQLLVATDAAKLVGCGYIRIDPSRPVNRSERHGYLGFMYVVPERRGQGISSLVLNALVEWGTGQGLDVFKLDVFSANATAVAAYEKFGFRSNKIEMVLER